jgi:hypothetical protein
MRSRLSDRVDGFVARMNDLAMRFKQPTNKVAMLATLLVIFHLISA